MVEADRADEVKAIAQYEDHARRTRIPAARRTFRHIAGEERHHLRELDAVSRRLRPRRNPGRSVVARWQSRGGKHWVEMYQDQYGFGYRADGGGGSFGNVVFQQAWEKVQRVLQSYARSGIKLTAVRTNPLTRDESRRIMTYARSVSGARMSDAQKKARFAGVKAAALLIGNQPESQNLIDEINRLESSLMQRNPRANPGVARAFAVTLKEAQARKQSPLFVARSVAKRMHLSPTETQQLDMFLRDMGARNPLTRKESGRLLGQARRWAVTARSKKISGGVRRWAAGVSHGMTMTARRFGPKTGRARRQIVDTARRIEGRADYLRNPSGGRKRTMTLDAFLAMIRKQRNPKLLKAVMQKIEGYKKWTHGTLPKHVTLEPKNVPGVEGVWVTYDMGKQPESLYSMPKGSKRKGLWRHPWTRWPSIAADPQSGLILTKLTKGNRITDFLHG